MKQKQIHKHRKQTWLPKETGPGQINKSLGLTHTHYYI